MRKLILNRIRTPDNTILESKHRHDFKLHKDKNNEIYINDGGTEYLKRSINIEPYTDLSLYSDDPFSIIRENITWGSRGKNGDEELKYKPISNMSTKHIKAILSNCILADYMKEIFEKELIHRNELEQKGLTESHWEEE